MRWGWGLLLLAAAAWAQPEALVVERLPFSLAGSWWFRPGHDPAWSSPFREKTHWQSVQVPGPWEKRGFAGYDGHAWYRITFRLPSELASETLGVDLGSIGDVDEVFLNGQRIGSTGSFPPAYAPGTLERRVYRLPRSALRFGEFNELAIHVYNEGRFGGLLGPAPRLDRYERLLRQQQGRDLLLWVSSTVLFVLGFFHVFLRLTSGGGREQWPWVAFLWVLACYQLSYASFGPTLLLSSAGSFRLNVACLLLAVGLFPLVVVALADQPPPTWAILAASTLGVGAGFSLVWRRTLDLYLWVYLAELAIVGFVVFALGKLAGELRRREAGAIALLGGGLAFFAAALADTAVDLAILPRSSLSGVTLYSSLGVLPFAVAASFVLASRWARHHAASLLPPLGLLPFGAFVEEIRKRIASPGSPPFAVALVRLATAAGTPVEVEAVIGDVRRHVRHCDLLARYSRETLAVVFEGVEEREALGQVERLRRALRQLPGAYLLRPSAGLAAFRPSRYGTAEELLKAAEAALYAARSEGGDTTATAP